jgi:hypothetical protein
VLIGLALGLAAQETAGWLGGSQASVDRRWHLGAEVLLNGLSGSELHSRIHGPEPGTYVLGLGVPTLV